MRARNIRAAGVKAALAIGLVSFALMGACGRIGFESVASEVEEPGDVDSGPLDASVALIDAMTSEIDASALPIDASSSDAAFTCDLGIAGCASESHSLGLDETLNLSGQLFNQGNEVVPPGGSCPFALTSADYSYRINLTDPGDITISSPSRTGWYLLEGDCSGPIVICSETGGSDRAVLSPGIYTLVIEDVGASGQCKSFDMVFRGPEGPTA